MNLLLCVFRQSDLFYLVSKALAQEQSPATSLAAPGAMKKHDDKCLKFMKSNNWLTLAPFAGVLVGKFSPNSQCNLILPILGIALGIGLRESRETP